MTSTSLSTNIGTTIRGTSSTTATLDDYNYLLALVSISTSYYEYVCNYNYKYNNHFPRTTPSTTTTTTYYFCYY